MGSSWVSWVPTAEWFFLTCGWWLNSFLKSLGRIGSSLLLVAWAQWFLHHAPASGKPEGAAEASRTSNRCFSSGNLVDISWFRAGYSYALYLRSADVASSSGFRERTLEDFLHPSIIQSIGVRVFFLDFVRLVYNRTPSSNLSLHRNLSDGIGPAQNCSKHTRKGSSCWVWQIRIAQ